MNITVGETLVEFEFLKSHLARKKNTINIPTFHLEIYILAPSLGLWLYMVPPLVFEPPPLPHFQVIIAQSLTLSQVSLQTHLFEVEAPKEIFSYKSGQIRRLGCR